MKRVQVGESWVAYDDLGPRRNDCVLVLAHGFAMNRSENWRRFGWYDLAQRKGLRCIAFDWRGHGESGKPREPEAYTGRAMAADLLALLTHLELSRVDLVAYSMGAMLGATAALAEPGRFCTLTLGGVGDAMLEPKSHITGMSEAMATEDPATIENPMARSFRQFADEQGEDRLALAACAMGRARLDPADFARLSVPTLVVAGARDTLAGSPAGLAAIIPGARSRTLPGCDHFSTISNTLFKASAFDFIEGSPEEPEPGW